MQVAITAPAPPSQTLTPQTRSTLLRALSSHPPDWLSILHLCQLHGRPAASATFFPPHPTPHNRLLTPLIVAARAHNPLYTSLILMRAPPDAAHASCALIAASSAASSPDASATLAAILAHAPPNSPCPADGCALDALGHALLAGCPARTRVLLRAGARATARYRDGSTPLHIAAARGVWENCMLLVEAGASVEVMRFGAGHGRTPAECAREEGFVDVAEKLEALMRNLEWRFIRLG